MKAVQQTKGPWVHRVLIAVFTLLLGVLIYWLLGFVVRDIGAWPGPTKTSVEEELIDPQLLREEREFRRDIEETTQAITDHQQQQMVLRDSTDNSRQTMNQLLDLQRLSLQKDIAPNEAQQRALAESETLFLQSQRQYQSINDRIASLTRSLRELQGSQRENKRRLQEVRAKTDPEFRTRSNRHRMKIAALQLAVLAPLLVVAGYLFLKKRASLYAPIIYALGIAVAVKVLFVMHEHFPTRYFKYILVIIALVLVARVLLYLLRMVAFPKRDWLFKQYREAYERLLCPICAYPIRRGPLRFLFWNRRTIGKIRPALSPSAGKEEPYHCPACGTRLYEECGECHGIRHALLPACSHCGSSSADE